MSAVKPGRCPDFTVRAGTELVAALRARGECAVEARCGGQLVDAIVHAGGDTGVVYVSSRELSHMPCASASAGRRGGGSGSLKGWLKGAAGKEKAGEDADGGSVPAEESWHSTKARIDALKAFPRAVLVVERARECDQGRTVALQVLSSRHVRCRLQTRPHTRACLSHMSRVTSPTRAHAHRWIFQYGTRHLSRSYRLVTGPVSSRSLSPAAETNMRVTAAPLPKEGRVLF